MANTGYGCEFGECPHAPVHLITDITAGSTVSLCDDHYAPGLIPLLAAALGVDPTLFYEHVKRYVDRMAKEAQRELESLNRARADAVDSEAPIDGCRYCSEPLIDGKPHEHAQPAGPDDAEVPA